MTLIISVLFGMESVDRYKGAAISMAGLCVLLLAQAAAQASQAGEGHAHAHAHAHAHGHGRGSRALEEVGDAAASATWYDGAWMLAPALLQII